MTSPGISRLNADTWTPERVADLRRLVDEGLTSTQVAAVMGLPRGAVMGKASRLKIEWKSAQSHGAAEIKRRSGPGGHISGMRIVDAAEARAKAVKKAAAAPIKADDSWADQPGSVALLNLLPWHCRWPVGQSPFRFCGCARMRPSSYCEAHAERAAGPGTKSERRADGAQVAA